MEIGTENRGSKNKAFFQEMHTFFSPKNKQEDKVIYLSVYVVHFLQRHTTHEIE